MSTKVINFYREGDQYGCFSNFSAHPVNLKGRRWPTSEHFFQAMKFEHSEKDLEEVRLADGPMKAALAGRDRSRPLRADWEEVKDTIMLQVVKAKFSEHADIRAILLSTGDATLVEHTKNDSYWGDGGDGSGKNMLGITLMKVRQMIIEEEEAKAADPNTVKFFRDDGEYGCFANFAAYEIEVDGLKFPTTEHYFQAMKFKQSEKDFDEVRTMATPKEAAKAGRDRSRPLRPDWEDVKMGIMEQALQAKFTQHADIREKLLGTGEKTLVEHSAKDNFWGDGGDGSGKNHMGRLLMKIRTDLQQ